VAVEHAAHRLVDEIGLVRPACRLLLSNVFARRARSEPLAAGDLQSFEVFL
jgi:hypothetical protein